MTIAKAQRAVEKAEAHRARARESLLKAVIIEAGANPRKVRRVEIDGFWTLLRVLGGTK
jgi:hypothetical protein